MNDFSIQATTGEPFQGQRDVRVRSLCVGGDIDTKSLRKTHCLAISPLVLEAGRCGCAVVFRYGAVVLFHVEPIEEVAFLEGLRPMILRPVAEPVLEQITLAISDDVKRTPEGDRIFVPSFSLPVLQVVAEVLARSVVLERFENKASISFDALRPIAANLGSGRLNRRQQSELLKRLSDVLSDQQQMVGRVSVTEKPDALWDRPELERLYARLTDEFEIPDRFEASDTKLDLIGSTIRTAIDLLQARHSLRVEWYIVALIVFEIFLSLYEMFIRHS